MKATTTILLMIFLIAGTISCTQEESGKSKQTVINLETGTKPDVISQKKKPDNMINKTKADSAKREYKFPSMMVKEDMYHEDYIDAERKTSLLTNLVVNRWEASGDKYRRTFIYASPEITYAELKEYLHFDDRDATYVNDPKPGDPQALIQTEWLTCNITFLSKVYDGKDKSVKLKAVLINNKVKANSDMEVEYDKNKGVIRKILDFFKVVHE